MNIAELALLNLSAFFISASCTSVLNYDKWRKGSGLSLWQVPKTICIHIILLVLVSLFVSNSRIFSLESWKIILVLYLFNIIAWLIFRAFLKPLSIPVSEVLMVTESKISELETLESEECSDISGELIDDYTVGLRPDERQIVKKIFSSDSINSFTTHSLKLPGINQGGLRINFKTGFINEMQNVNMELSGLYNSLAPFGFLILRYIPIGSKSYSIFEGNKNRIKKISRAELWGRLHYCGFEVINEIEDDSVFIILAQKTNEKRDLNNPSVGKIIKLKRIGYKGSLFFAYKIRTMYPYSEFIQAKVYQLNSLSGSGKIRNDFRITPAGKYLRRYWIDELPQIFNWLRGDIKLVGIRGMSLHYFNLYPEYYKTAYLSVKPGLVPPIFEDSNDSFEYIIETEYKYLTDYLESPAKTDLINFFKTFNSILLKGVRGH